jgi:hypothetical protein
VKRHPARLLDAGQASIDLGQRGRRGAGWQGDVSHGRWVNISNSNQPGCIPAAAGLFQFENFKTLPIPD